MKYNALYNLYCDAARNALNNVVDIYEPHVCGTQHNVLIAKTSNNEKHVLKFSTPEIVQKNASVSKIYNIRGIPVPQINACTWRGLYFEEYKILPGKTLFEAIGNGMKQQQIKDVFQEIMLEFAKMIRVHPQLIENKPENYVHNIARENIASVNSPLLGNIFMGLVYALNIGNAKDFALCHSDITPKNVIVSDTGKLVGFIDMDSVCVCNKHYAFGMMAAKYQELGFDIKELFEQFEQISSTRINHARIETMASMCNLGKKILWKHAQNKRQK